MSQIIKIIGIGEGGKNTLPRNFLDWIYNCEVLVGGQRLLNFFPDYEGEKILLTNKIHEIIEVLKNKKKDIVILASGDPLFFGIGGVIISHLKSTFENEANIEIYPNLSSLQLAFAKAKMDWQDAKFISVHGRKISGLAQKIFPDTKIALLTDLENHPAKIAAYLLEYNLSNYRVFVAENLGMENERYKWYSLQELAHKTSDDFYNLNVMILSCGKPETAWSLGIPDSEFSYPEKPNALITKKEIRVLSISEMNLNKHSVVWDIGSCSGSVAIEAAHIAREGHVYAVEKNLDHLEHCRKNVRKLHADISIIENVAPEGLEKLPDADAIFIGGSGGYLREILRISSDRLKSHGRMVVNATTLETLNTALDFFNDNDFETSVILAQISRSRSIAELTGFHALNPVFILTARQRMDAVAT